MTRVHAAGGGAHGHERQPRRSRGRVERRCRHDDLCGGFDRAREVVKMLARRHHPMRQTRPRSGRRAGTDLRGHLRRSWRVTRSQCFRIDGSELPLLVLLTLYF